MAKNHFCKKGFGTVKEFNNENKNDNKYHAKNLFTRLIEMLLHYFDNWMHFFLVSKATVVTIFDNGTTKQVLLTTLTSEYDH